MIRRDPSSQTCATPVGASVLPACCSKHVGRRGAATVELAVIVPVFFLFLFGLIEIGRGFMVVHLLNNAARDGCRKGVVRGKSNTDITDKINSLMTSHGVKGHTTTIKVNDVVKDVSAATPNDEVTVTLSVPVANVTWLPGGQYLKGTLSARYSLRRE